MVVDLDLIDMFDFNVVVTSFGFPPPRSSTAAATAGSKSSVHTAQLLIHRIPEYFLFWDYEQPRKKVLMWLRNAEIGKLRGL